MEASSQIFSPGAILHDYERDPVFVSLKTANDALKSQVEDLSKRLAFTEALIIKRFNVNFDAAIKDMCRYVKQDKTLSKQLEASLRHQNNENSLKLLEIFLSETSVEEGFVLCDKPIKSDCKPIEQNASDIHDELSYYLNQIKGHTLDSDAKIDIQSTLDDASKEMNPPMFPIKNITVGAMKAAWAVSKFLYKESIRLGTFALSATPLILFCLLVNEINKLTKGFALQTAISGLSLIGRLI